MLEEDVFSSVFIHFCMHVCMSLQPYVLTWLSLRPRRPTHTNYSSANEVGFVHSGRSMG